MRFKVGDVVRISSSFDFVENWIKDEPEFPRDTNGTVVGFRKADSICDYPILVHFDGVEYNGASTGEFSDFKEHELKLVRRADA